VCRHPWCLGDRAENAGADQHDGTTNDPLVGHVQQHGDVHQTADDDDHADQIKRK
jgi:flavin-dependent dehydrogenase